MNRNKMNARQTVCRSGHVHDSQLEALRCNELNLLLKAGKIENLEIQKRYLLIPATKYPDPTANEKKVEYIADFVYYDKELEKTVIEDSKGFRTRDYVLKRKLMKRLYCNESTVFLETGKG